MKDELEYLDNRKIKETLNDLIKLYQNIHETKKSGGIFIDPNYNMLAKTLRKLRITYSSIIEEQFDKLDKKKFYQLLTLVGLIDLILIDLKK